MILIVAGRVRARALVGHDARWDGWKGLRQEGKGRGIVEEKERAEKEKPGSSHQGH